MKKNKLQTTLTHLFKKERGRYTKRELHPTRDWLLGLLVCLVCVSIGGAVSAHQFVYYKNVDTFQGEFTKTIAPYNAKAVESGIMLFSKRRSAFEELKNTEFIVAEQKPQTVVDVATTSSEASELPVEDDISTDQVSPVVAN